MLTLDPDAEARGKSVILCVCVYLFLLSTGQTSAQNPPDVAVVVSKGDAP